MLLGGAAVVLDRRGRGLSGGPSLENLGAVPRLAAGARACACACLHLQALRMRSCLHVLLF